MQPEPHPDRILFHEVSQDQDLDNHAAFGTYALILVCNLDIDFVKVQAVYDKEVIPEEQMQRMLNQFAHILQQVTLESQTRVADLSALDPEDIEQLKSWNGQIPEKVDTCVHTLIENAAFATSARAYIKTAGLNSDVRALQFASYAFGVSISDTLVTLWLVDAFVSHRKQSVTTISSGQYAG
jgi:hypothetical protein